MPQAPAYGFSDQDKADIRRYLGYPPLGTGVVIFPEAWTFPSYLALEARLNNLLASEAQTILTYLGQLRTLEAAIPGTSDNLDTAAAAVWTHNPSELRDRMNLYRTWRLELASILGIPAGPNLTASSSGMRCRI
jgi:hypothetical protein